MKLIECRFELQREELFDLLLYLSALTSFHLERIENAWEQLLSQVESEAARSPLIEGERYVLWLLRGLIISAPPLGSPSARVVRLSRLINDGSTFFLVPGEAWTDALNDDLSRLDEKSRMSWIALSEAHPDLNRGPALGQVALCHSQARCRDR